MQPCRSQKTGAASACIICFPFRAHKTFVFEGTVTPQGLTFFVLKIWSYRFGIYCVAMTTFNFAGQSLQTIQSNLLF
eukprot:UN04200